MERGYRAGHENPFDRSLFDSVSDPAAVAATAAGVSDAINPRPRAIVNETPLKLACERLEDALLLVDDDLRPAVSYWLGTTINLYLSQQWNPTDPASGHDRERLELGARCRTLLQSVGDDVSAPVDIRRKAWTNIGASLFRWGRYVEAAASHIEALAIDRTFVKSKLYLADILATDGAGSSDDDLANTPRGFEKACAASWVAEAGGWDAVQEELGADSVRQIGLYCADAPDQVTQFTGLPSPQREWIRNQRLNFGDTILGAAGRDACSDDRWIPGIGLDNDEVRRLLNDLKADFLLARQLLWNATVDTMQDAALYVESGHDHWHGIGPSSAKAALVLAVNGLDKLHVPWIAVIEPNLLGAAVDPSGKKGPKLGLRDLADTSRLDESLAKEVTSPTDWHVRAIVGIARDLLDAGKDTPAGPLSELFAVRNAATHRSLTVLAGTPPEIANQPFANGGHISFERLQVLAARAMRTLRAGIRHTAHTAHLRAGREYRPSAAPAHTELGELC